MRYPGFLKDNGRIGFVAPSFGCASLEPYHTRFLSALSYFESLHYTTVVGPNVYSECGIGKSNTPEKCGEEINDFFLKDLSDVIWSVGGGETMCEDLGHIRFDAIAKARPIWYLGYSDNTCLTFTLPTLCDTAAIYTANASSYGMKPLHRSLTDTLDLLCGRKLTFTNYDAWESESLATPEDPTAPLNTTQPFSCTLYRNGLFDAKEDLLLRGRMLGGCLDVLCCLCGTEFDKTVDFIHKYEEDGILWFLESCDLNPLSVLRGLWQLKNAGWFENAKGFLFGRPLHYNESIMGLDCRQACIHVLKDLDVPILFDIDLGHLPPQMPFLSGAVGNLQKKGNALSITYELR